MNNQPQEYYTPYQLKFPVEIEKIIETTDPVYTFCEVMLVGLGCTGLSRLSCKCLFYSQLYMFF